MTFKQWWDGMTWSLGARLLFKPLAQLFAEIAWNAAVRAEREACAKLCDDLDDDIVDGLAGWQYAEAIRARGNVATNDTSQERVDETTKQRHDNPPQRTWVGLTDEEQQAAYDAWQQKDDGWGSFYALIEAKLKEKNT
jgi:hypothetical protein